MQEYMQLQDRQEKNEHINVVQDKSNKMPASPKKEEVKEEIAELKSKLKKGTEMNLITIDRNESDNNGQK